MKTDLDELSPKEIVSELDRYIVGQKKAKKAVEIERIMKLILLFF